MLKHLLPSLAVVRRAVPKVYCWPHDHANPFTIVTATDRHPLCKGEKHDADQRLVDPSEILLVSLPNPFTVLTESRHVPEGRAGTLVAGYWASILARQSPLRVRRGPSGHRSSAAAEYRCGPAGICQNSPQIFGLVQDVGAVTTPTTLFIVVAGIFGAKPDRFLSGVCDYPGRAHCFPRRALTLRLLCLQARGMRLAALRRASGALAPCT